MIGFSASNTGRAAVFASLVLVGLPQAAHAQSGAPIRLAPPQPLITTPNQPLEAPAEPANQGLRAVPGVSVRSLGTVASEAVGAIGPRQGAFGANLWSGANRAMVERLIPELPARSSSRVVRDLTRRLLLTAAVPPAGDGNRDFVALRAERLLAMGAVDSATSLIDNAPAGKRGEELQSIAVEADLLRYDLTSACAEVERNRAIFTEFWQKVTVFCNVLADDQTQAILGLDLLREQGATGDSLFFDLVDVLLSGAEAGEVAGGKPTPLNLALLRAARAQIPIGFLENAEPGVLRAIALSPNAPDNIRLRAGLAADRIGALEQEPIRELLQAHLRQGRDNELATIADLVLGAAEETVPTARAARLQRGLTAAQEAGLYVAFARLSVDSLRDLAPSRDIAWFGRDAALALLLNGEVDAALGWYQVMRAEGRFDPELARPALELWPALRIALAVEPSVSAASSRAASETAAIADAVSAASVSPSGRASVIEQLVSPSAAATTPDRFPYDEQELLAWIDQVGPDASEIPTALSMLAALGDPVGAGAWAELVGTEAGAETAPLNPVLWLALQQAVLDRRLGEAILLAMVLVGENDLRRTNQLTLYGAVNALHTVGLVEEARALAIEALLAAGT